jgi:hypothetical protein
MTVLDRALGAPVDRWGIIGDHQNDPSPRPVTPVRDPPDPSSNRAILAGMVTHGPETLMDAEGCPSSVAMIGWGAVCARRDDAG